MPKQAASILEVPQAEIAWTDITPEWAQAALEGDPINRAVSQRWVQQLAARMSGGEWDSTLGDPFRIDKDGHLVDGQHRCWAVIESGVTIRALVVRNLSPDSLMLLDGGRKRSLGDYLHIKHEANSDQLSATLRYLHFYLRPDGPGELVNQDWHLFAPTVPQALALLNEHPGLRNAVVVGRRIASVLGGGAGRWGAAYYVLQGIDSQDAADFTDQLQTGANLASGSPVYQLRKRVMEDRGKNRKMAVREYTALIFKAWNLYRDGASVEQLQWRAGGAHPEHYPVPQ